MDVAIDGTLSQLIDHDFVPQVLEVVGPRNAGALNLGAQLLHRHAIALGDDFGRLLGAGVGDLNVEPFGFLVQQRVVDHALQHLTAQNLGIRHSDVLLLELCLRLRGFDVHLAQGDDLLVDHGGDAVDDLVSGGVLAGRFGLSGRRRLRGGRGGSAQQHEQQRRKSARRVRTTHYSYLSKVVFSGMGGATVWYPLMERDSRPIGSVPSEPRPLSSSWKNTAVLASSSETA